MTLGLTMTNITLEMQNWCIPMFHPEDGYIFGVSISVFVIRLYIKCNPGHCVSSVSFHYDAKEKDSICNRTRRWCLVYEATRQILPNTQNKQCVTFLPCFIDAWLSSATAVRGSALSACVTGRPSWRHNGGRTTLIQNRKWFFLFLLEVITNIITSVRK